MMYGSTEMMLGIGLFCLLFVIVLILSIAALGKYLFGVGQNNKSSENSNA